MDFTQFKDRVRANFRIDLSAYKENQLKRRIDGMMSKHKLAAGDYTGFIKSLNTDKKVYTEFLDTLTINVSEFFRDKKAFDYLEETVLPDLLRSRVSLKIWSAACSSGAEPYSIAMILSELDPRGRHKIEGSDIDRNILRAAAAARYSQDQVRNVSKPRLVKYFKKENNHYLLTDDYIKGSVTFKHHDLLLDQFNNGYDLIACRNVTIYFTREAQERLTRGFYRSLNPGGVLFIGASEMIFNYGEIGLEKLASCFYRRISRHDGRG